MVLKGAATSRGFNPSTPKPCTKSTSLVISPCLSTFAVYVTTLVPLHASPVDSVFTIISPTISKKHPLAIMFSISSTVTKPSG